MPASVPIHSLAASVTTRSGTFWYWPAVAATTPSWCTTSPDMRDIEIRAAAVPDAGRIITPEALSFLEQLGRQFGPARRALLQRRREVQRSIHAGARPHFLAETSDIRAGDWTVAAAPSDLNDRRVEITGPVERKMMINALNSGARVFMGDFEDALSPPWSNVVGGQASFMDAVRRTLEFASPEGKRYRLAE